MVACAPERLREQTGVGVRCLADIGDGLFVASLGPGASSRQRKFVGNEVKRLDPGLGEWR